MNNGPLKSILMFLASRYNQLIIIMAILGILLALQGKQEVTLTDHNPLFLVEETDINNQAVRVKPPIHFYSGLIRVDVEYQGAKSDLDMAASCGDKYITSTKLLAGKESSSSFMLYTGEYNTATGLSLLLTNQSGTRPAQVIKSVTFSFPKTGNWLIPDLILWAFLSLILIIFGLICGLIWRSPVNVMASFAATAITMILVLHFGGLDLAQRIGGQLFAVIFLFIVALLVRIFFIKPGPVEIQE